MVFEWLLSLSVVPNPKKGEKRSKVFGSIFSITSYSLYSGLRQISKEKYYIDVSSATQWELEFLFFPQEAKNW